MMPDLELMRSFGRCERGQSEVYRPTSIDDVNQVFAIAKKNGQRITIRGGGHSFDGQAVQNGDTGKQIVLCTDNFNAIDFATDGSTVTLGSGVKWGDFVNQSISNALANHGPILIPGSMQTGGNATAGGTLSGDCLSRFSGTVGKESQWIESFRIVTPNNPVPLNVNVTDSPDLFNAVIGGQGYIGFVTDVTYKLIAIDNQSCAHSTITLYQTFNDMVQAQIDLVNQFKGTTRAISSAWFTDLPNPILPSSEIKGGVFNSIYAKPSNPQLPGYPLYNDIQSEWRVGTELAARGEPANYAIHLTLYLLAQNHGGQFENDLKDFIFFMDGNTYAKDQFETLFAPDLFPIVQQTFVIPDDKTVAFAQNCEAKMLAANLRPTESDMLFVAADNCLMSAHYKLDGFAVTLAFEPIAPQGCAPANIPALLKDLSVDCLNAGGRIHLTKNANIDQQVFRNMFSPQITTFENIKRQYDPDKLLQNPFSDAFFNF